MITSCKNWGIPGNSAKSTNNPMSSFGLDEENMELSPFVKLYIFKKNLQQNDFYQTQELLRKNKAEILQIFLLRLVPYLLSCKKKKKYNKKNAFYMDEGMNMSLI